MPHTTPLPVLDTLPQRREPTPPLEWAGDRAVDAARFLQTEPLVQEMLPEEMILGAPLLGATSGPAWDAALQAGRYAAPIAGTAAKAALGPLTSLQMLLNPSDTQSQEDEFYAPFQQVQKDILEAYSYEGQQPTPEFVQMKALEHLQRTDPEYLKWLMELSQMDELP